MGYLSNFIVYMLAMVGVMMLALFIFKHSTAVKFKNGGSKYLKVVDSLSLGARKTLYIVSAGAEKFLIAGDLDRTTLISKLNSQSGNEVVSNITESVESADTASTFKEMLANLPKKQSFADKKGLGIRGTQRAPYDSVMKNLAERIRG